MAEKDLSGISFDLDDGVTLRTFVHTDAGPIFETVKRNEHHLMQFMHWMTPDYSPKMAEEFVERSISAARNGESLGFGIFRNGEFIGSIGFTHFDYIARKTEIGYWIDKDEQGKGVISRATKHLIDLAFDEFDMNRIEIRCSTANQRSAAIPERFGFKLEGHLRQSELRNGELHDFYIFGILRSEWGE